LIISSIKIKEKNMSIDILNGNLGNILNFLAAAGGLGTASFGLVDATKAIRGGVSNAGFRYVRKAVEPLIDGADQSGPKIFGRADIIATLRANWLNGVVKADQKATAKALIRLGLTSDNAAKLAETTGVDPSELKTCVENMRKGVALTQQDFNILGRFDAIVGAVLDEGYERADQQYRNTSKLLAGIASIVLAVVAGGLIFTTAYVDTQVSLSHKIYDYLHSSQLLVAILIGAVSTPLAPVAKDLSSTLQAAVKAVGVVKG
jgi:hypothetical protein